MKSGMTVLCFRRARIWALIFAGHLAAVLSLAGAESLIDHPPFKPVERSDSRPVETIATQGSLNERFQFSGFFEGTEGVKFSIQDQKNSKPYWVSLGESMDGVKVESWDPEKLGVVLSQGGKKEMLVIKELKTGASTRPIPPMYNPVPQNVPTTYPSPPPSLPKPTQLMEKLRREQARKTNN